MKRLAGLYLILAAVAATITIARAAVIETAQT